MPTIKMLSGEEAAALLKYVDTDKAEQDAPRVLHAAGLLCNPNTATKEFQETRRKHGKQGAVRKAAASYELPDDGEVAVYVRRVSRTGRPSWGLANNGETATHLRREGVTYEKLTHGESDGTHRRVGRTWTAVDAADATHRAIEGGYQKEREVIHMIHSYGLHEVNPDNPDDVLRAFENTLATVKELFPGAQAKLIGQADSTGALDGSGQAKFHVHVVLNATVARRMEYNSDVWEPGRKLSGALTDIELVRDRADAFLTAHPENGFKPLAKSSRDRKAEIRRDHDNRLSAKGKISTDDVLRTAYEESLDAMIVLHASGQSVDLGTLRRALSARDVETKHDIVQTGRNQGKETLSLWNKERGTDKNGKRRWRRGSALGAHYTLMDTADKTSGEVIPGIKSQLEATSQGKEPERRPARVQAGPAKHLPTMTTEEISEAERLMVRLAQRERERRAAEAEIEQWINERAAERGMAWGDIRDLMPADSSKLPRVVRLWRTLEAQPTPGPQIQPQPQPLTDPTTESQTDATATSTGKVPAQPVSRQPTTVFQIEPPAPVQMRRATFEELIAGGRNGPVWVPDLTATPAETISEPESVRMRDATFDELIASGRSGPFRVPDEAVSPAETISEPEPTPAAIDPIVVPEGLATPLAFGSAWMDDEDEFIDDDSEEVVATSESHIGPPAFGSAWTNNALTDKESEEAGTAESKPMKPPQAVKPVRKRVVMAPDHVQALADMDESNPEGNIHEP